MYILIERFGNYDECETKVVDYSSNKNELLDKAEKLNSLVAKDKEDFEKAKLLFVEYEALLNARHTIERSRNSKYSVDDINKDFTEKFVIPENLKKFFFKYSDSKYQGVYFNNCHYSVDTIIKETIYKL